MGGAGGLDGGAVTAGRHGRTRVKAAAGLVAGLVALLWVLEGVDVLTGHALDAYGVSPREVAELRDVVPSAFLHFGFDHVAANSGPLLVFGFLAALRGVRRFLAVVAFVVVVDGLGVWLVSPAYTNTAGASGLVFGLFGYLVARGFADRRALDVLVGLVVAASWGSTVLLGISPAQSGVSWQGHLFGLVAGVAAAFVLRRRPGGRSGAPPYGGGAVPVR
ncbi:MULTISPECIES: rhomboid family intramembrane serine protease [Streptomyces]|uniref:Rhomboid family intramembrane serine protease n=2 Tax=Streptomyces TaxID=1883 RepID=A0A100Y0G2_9ACTN|nr:MULTISPECIES: rhomboid family intramembrane serine protease [Streptomyces]KUH35396.1 rhomboid family intramembrane serine protease [Streptomyces kanasensis]UUS34876.1 rhomboid family intramembrane serine protease [Streptomyces changanensis]